MKYFIIILLGLTSCTLDSKHDQSDFKLNFTNGQCDHNYLHSPNQLEGNFKALYYGPKLSQIGINLAESFSQYKMLAHFNHVMNIQDPNLAFLVGRHPIIAQSDYVTIFIDTTQQIGTIYGVNESQSVFGKRDTCVMHYPIIIESKNFSFFQIGYGDDIILNFEAINLNGKWASISYPPIIWCGTGLQSVSLPPKEIVISALPITIGNYKTKGRLRLGNAFSNEIFIAIDSTTFNSGLN